MFAYPLRVTTQQTTSKIIIFIYFPYQLIQHFQIMKVVRVVCNILFNHRYNLLEHFFVFIWLFV